MMKPMRKLLALLLVMGMSLMLLPGAAMAAAEANAKIDLSAATTDQSGDGWTWNYATKTFTLTDNLKITITRTNNDDYYGLILPAGSTVDCNGKALSVWFMGFHYDDIMGFGTGVSCEGDLTVRNGVIFVTRDGADILGVRAMKLRMEDATIQAMGLGESIKSLEVFGTNSLVAAFANIRSRSRKAVPITGSGVLNMRVTNPGYVTPANFTVSDGVAVFTAEGEDAPASLYQSATIATSTDLPQKALIPAGKTLNVATGTDITLRYDTTNNGSININGGTLLNNAVLTNNGSIVNSGVLDNEGTLYQNGSITGNAVTGSGQVIYPTPRQTREPVSSTEPLPTPQVNEMTAAYLGNGTFRLNNSSSVKRVVLDNVAVSFTQNGFELKLEGVTPGEHTVTIYSPWATLTTVFTAEAAPVPTEPVTPPQTGDAATTAGFLMLLVAAALAVCALRRRHA